MEFTYPLYIVSVENEIIKIKQQLFREQLKIFPQNIKYFDMKIVNIRFKMSLTASNDRWM